MPAVPILVLAAFGVSAAGARAQPTLQSPAASPPSQTSPSSPSTEAPQAPASDVPEESSSQTAPAPRAPRPAAAEATAAVKPTRPGPASAAVKPTRSGPAAAECACEQEPGTEHVIEVTFGSAQLFNRYSTATPSGTVDREIIPVSSALLMVEWLFMHQLSAVMLATLPLEEQAVLIDGELRYEFAAPSVSLGMRGTPLGFDAFWDSTVELQLAAFVGRTLGSSSGDIFFPLVAGRVHIRTAEGFALYLGSAFAFERDTLALIYGVGHRF